MASILTAEAVIKRYGDADDALTIIDGLNLHVEAGEFVSLVGPSG
jgi:ABC-type sugar transport system ATPase subunit